MYIYLYIYVNTHICKYLCIYIYLYVYKCAYMYIFNKFLFLTYQNMSFTKMNLEN